MHIYYYKWQKKIGREAAIYCKAKLNFLKLLLMLQSSWFIIEVERGIWYGKTQEEKLVWFLPCKKHVLFTSGGLWEAFYQIHYRLIKFKDFTLSELSGRKCNQQWRKPTWSDSAFPSHPPRLGGHSPGVYEWLLRSRVRNRKDGISQHINFTFFS